MKNVHIPHVKKKRKKEKKHRDENCGLGPALEFVHLKRNGPSGSSYMPQPSGLRVPALDVSNGVYSIL